MTHSENLSTNSEARLNPVRDENLAVAQAAAREWLQDLSEAELFALITNPEKFTQRVLQKARVSLSEKESEQIYQITHPLFENLRRPDTDSEEVIEQFVSIMRRENMPAAMRTAIALLMAALIAAFSALGEHKSAHAADASETPTATSTPILVPTETPTPVGTNAPEQVVLPTPTATQELSDASETADNDSEESIENDISVETVTHTYRQIIVEIANVRQTPSTSAEIISKVPRGTEVEIITIINDESGREWALGRFILIEEGKTKEYEGYIATELMGSERTDTSVTYTGESIGGSLTEEQLLEDDPFRANVEIQNGKLVITDHLGQAIETYDNEGSEVVSNYEILSQKDLQDKILAGEIDQKFQDAITYFPDKLLVTDQAGEPVWVDAVKMRPVYRMVDGTLQAVVEMGEGIDPKFLEWFPVDQEPARRGWGVLQFATGQLQYFIDAAHPIENDSYQLSIKNQRKLAGVLMGNIETVKSSDYAEEYLGTNGDFSLIDWFADEGYFDPKSNLPSVNEITGSDLIETLVNNFFKLAEKGIEEVEAIKNLKIRLLRHPQYGDDRGYSKYLTGSIGSLPKNPFRVENNILLLDLTAYNPDSVEASTSLILGLSHVLNAYYKVETDTKNPYDNSPSYPLLDQSTFTFTRNSDGEINVIPILIPISQTSN